MAVPLLVVGGFLGAGKTTLVERAARLLSADGRYVGIVTNDHAADAAQPPSRAPRSDLPLLRGRRLLAGPQKR